MERDPTVIDWTTRLTALATSQTLLTHTNVNALSDGLLYTNFGTVQFNGSVSLTAQAMKSIGVHLTGPLVVDAAATEQEYTPYQITAQAFCEGPDIRPILWMAESPATITSDATGDNCPNWKMIGQCMTHGLQGATLSREITVLVKKTPSVRNVCFGIAFHGGAVPVTLEGAAHVTVRRIIGVSPTVIDTRKL